MKSKNFNILKKEVNIYELIGIILGDGCILYYPDHGIYGLEIAGNADEQLSYFQEISKLIYDITGKKSRIETRYLKLGKGLRLVIYSKSFTDYLIKDLGLPYKNKTFNTFIPKQFTDWEFSKHILRGLFETDGSLYFSRTRPHKKPTYPRLEIKTSSIKLARQIKETLERKAFKAGIRISRTDRTMGVYLSGPDMLNKWVQEIGFSTTKNIAKYQFWKRLGYNIPHLPLSKRLKMNASVAKPG